MRGYSLGLSIGGGVVIPEHYSRDIALRCQSLIRELRPVVKGGLADDRRFGGPLETTFLLALATPMIVLPIERIFKPAEPGAAPAGDDRKLDPALAEEMADVLGPMQNSVRRLSLGGTTGATFPDTSRLISRTPGRVICSAILTPRRLLPARAILLPRASCVIYAMR